MIHEDVLVDNSNFQIIWRFFYIKYLERIGGKISKFFSVSYIIIQIEMKTRLKNNNKKNQ